MRFRRAGLLRTVLPIVVALVAALAACAGDGARWPCPAEWVPAAGGGCGPAVVLCAPDGGAAPGACASQQLTASRAVPLPDGGTGATFYLQPDGAIGGGWHAPGDPGGPPALDWTPALARPDGGVPAPDWSPDAGIAACPAGWIAQADGSCDPALATSCPAGSAPLPGGACTATAERDCPAGEYADVGAESVGATTVHVRAGAPSTGADGSVARPYDTIAAGVAAAGANGWVLLAAGAYPETLAVTLAVHVVGQCAAHVTLATTGSMMPAASASGSGAALDLRGVTVAGVFALDGARVRLRQVSVANAPGPGVAVNAGAVDASDVLVAGNARGQGLLVYRGGTLDAARTSVAGAAIAGVLAQDSGSRATLSDVVVHNTVAGASRADGSGLSAQSGAQLSATRVVVLANQAVGVTAGLGAQLTLTDAVVRGTLARALDRTGGFGLEVDSGATLRATRAQVASNRAAGAFAYGRGASLVLDASVVRDTQARVADGGAGHGLEAGGGGAVHATRTLVAGNHAIGAAASGSGSRVELADSVVRDTQAADANRLGGFGVDAEAGAALSATRVLLVGNRAAAVFAFGDGSAVTLSDCVVRDTQGRVSDGAAGHGLEAGGGGAVRATRTLVVGNRSLGATAAAAGSRVELTDCEVRDTQPRAGEQTGGFGLDAESGGALSATRTLVAGNHAAGAFAFGEGSVLTLDACEVRDTQVRASDGATGHGLEADGGGAVRATRTLVAGNRTLGVTVSGVGSRVELTECEVRDTLPRPSDRLGGFGLYVESGGVLSATRTLVAGNRAAGALAFGAGSTLVLTDSAVRDTLPREADGDTGSGVEAGGGARAELTRALVANNYSLGVGASGAGSAAALADSVVQRTMPRARDLEFGRGVEVNSGAAASLLRTLVADSRDMGIFANNEGSTLTLDDSAVTGTQGDGSDGNFGVGVSVNGGAAVRAARTLVRASHEGGVLLYAGGPSATLTDVLVQGVAPSARGFGIGVAVIGSGRVDATRLSVTDVAGAATVAVPYQDVTLGRLGGARFTAEDVFVRGVSASTVQFSDTGVTLVPQGQRVAYGLHVGSGCELDVTRALVTDASYGFFHSLGALTLRTGVIARQREAAGASNGADATHPVLLEGVTEVDNAVNDVLRDTQLPEAQVPPPPPPTLAAGP